MANLSDAIESNIYQERSLSSEIVAVGFRGSTQPTEGTSTIDIGNPATHGQYDSSGSISSDIIGCLSS
jgi:hypothetical protein